MNWEAVFYEWLLARILEAVASDPPPDRPDPETTVAPRVTGQHSRDPDRGYAFTDRQSNLNSRPGRTLLVGSVEGRRRALGDGTRRRGPAFQDGPSLAIVQPLMPSVAPWSQIAGEEDDPLRFWDGSQWVELPQPVWGLVPRPELRPPIDHIAARQLLGHRPIWGDWAWLATDAIDKAWYVAGREGDDLYVQGPRNPLWRALSGASGAGLHLPIAPNGSGVPTLYAYPPIRSEEPGGTAPVEKGSPPSGSGLIYRPDTLISVFFNITPSWICVYPGGDYATRTVEYAWRGSVDHAYAPDEQAYADDGIRVQAYGGYLSDFVAVTDTPQTVIRVKEAGSVDVDTVPAETYTFTPPGSGIEGVGKVYSFERTWSFTKDVTIQPTDWVVHPDVRFTVDTGAVLAANYGNGVTQVQINGAGPWSKGWEGTDPAPGSGAPWLVKPDPNDDTTWYWVSAPVAIGDQVVFQPSVGGAGTINFVNPNLWNAPEFDVQHALVIDVQPATAAPEDNQWILTFRSAVNGLTTDLLVTRSRFAKQIAYFADAPGAVTFTRTDEVTVKVRPTTLLRPSTIAYNKAGYNSETNWLDHTYTGGDPPAREALLWLLHTIGWEVYFKRTQSVSDGVTTWTETEENTQLYNLADTATAAHQQLQILVPGTQGTSMLTWTKRIGSRKPTWNELSALLDQGYAGGSVQFRRDPLPDDDPYDSLYDCPPVAAVPELDVVNDWPETTYVISDNGYENLCLHPDVHAVGAPIGTEPYAFMSVFRRDHHRYFNGNVEALLLHPPDPSIVEREPGVEDGFTRDWRRRASEAIYSGVYGTLNNPWGLAAGASGGTWCGITIPTRFYDADAFVIPGEEGAPDVLYGVVLAWDETRVGQTDEFMLHVSVDGAPETPQPVFRYFPDAMVGDPAQPEVATRVFDVASASWWPDTIDALERKISPTYSFLHPDWPYQYAQVGPFTARAYNRYTDRKGVTYSRFFEGRPVITLGLL